MIRGVPAAAALNSLPLRPRSTLAPRQPARESCSRSGALKSEQPPARPQTRPNHRIRPSRHHRLRRHRLRRPCRRTQHIGATGMELSRFLSVPLLLPPVMHCPATAAPVAGGAGAPHSSRQLVQVCRIRRGSLSRCAATAARLRGAGRAGRRPLRRGHATSAAPHPTEIPAIEGDEM